MTPTQAAQLLPWRTSRAMAWLRRNGLIRTVSDEDGEVEVVVWGAVVAKLEEPPKRRKPRKLAREKL